MLITGMKKGKWEIGFNKRKNFIFVKSNGRLNNRDVTQMKIEAIGFARKYQVQNFLLDHRELIPELSIIDIYYIPGINRSLKFFHTGKLAVVYSESTDFNDKFTFLETVAYNNGMKMKLFKKIQDAEQWLNE